MLSKLNKSLNIMVLPVALFFVVLTSHARPVVKLEVPPGEHLSVTSLKEKLKLKGMSEATHGATFRLLESKITPTTNIDAAINAALDDKAATPDVKEFLDAIKANKDPATSRAFYEHVYNVKLFRISVDTKAAAAKTAGASQQAGAKHKGDAAVSGGKAAETTNAFEAQNQRLMEANADLGGKLLGSDQFDALLLELGAKANDPAIVASALPLASQRMHENGGKSLSKTDLEAIASEANSLREGKLAEKLAAFKDQADGLRRSLESDPSSELGRAFVELRAASSSKAKKAAMAKIIAKLKALNEIASYSEEEKSSLRTRFTSLEANLEKADDAALARIEQELEGRTLGIVKHEDPSVALCRLDCPC